MKQEKLELIIPKKLTGKRVDIALQELMADFSRAKLQAWIKSGFGWDLGFSSNKMLKLTLCSIPMPIRVSPGLIT